MNYTDPHVSSVSDKHYIEVRIEGKVVTLGASSSREHAELLAEGLKFRMKDSDELRRFVRECEFLEYYEDVAEKFEDAEDTLRDEILNYARPGMNEPVRDALNALGRKYGVEVLENY